MMYMYIIMVCIYIHTTCTHHGVHGTHGIWYPMVHGVQGVYSPYTIHHVCTCTWMHTMCAHVLVRDDVHVHVHVHVTVHVMMYIITYTTCAHYM